MDQCEDREEGVPPSKTTLCGEHESQTEDQRVDQESSRVPSGHSSQQHQTDLDILKLLEDNIISFVKNELKKIQKVLSTDNPECLESQREDEEVLVGEDEEQRTSREAFQKITLHILRTMKQEKLSEPVGKVFHVELAMVRKEFVGTVSSVVLAQLVEALVTDGVLNDVEKEWILEANQSRADKARCLIDSVRKKGEKASRIMIRHLQTIDPFLSSELGLSSHPSSHSAAVFQKETSVLSPSRDDDWNHFQSKNIYSVTTQSRSNRVALLITNQSLNRHSTEKDEQSMFGLLQDLEYEVVQYRNLTAKEIDRALIKFSKHPKLPLTDSVFVVIMSRGDNGVLFGTDHDMFKTEQIYERLSANNCPALLNKPKVIIIQTFRGMAVLMNKPDMAAKQRSICREKDCISFFFCAPGTVPYRSKANGSFFIQHIVEVFKTFSSEVHIEEMFRKVMQCFEDCPSNTMQMPTKERCTLTKSFYLFPTFHAELAMVRTEFVCRVSNGVLTKLIHALVSDGVLNDEERGSILAANQFRADKARCVIDTVRKKGDEACRRMIRHLQTIDPFLSSKLGLSSRPSSHSGDSQVKLDPNAADTKLMELMEPLSCFTPEVQTESEQISYRFNFPGSGLFQCSLTGLVFDMIQEAELLYRIIQWDERSLTPTGKTPAGPLFDIKGHEDAVCRLHFPHCETKEALQSGSLLSVVHFSDDGMSVLKPLEITDTHVIVDVPHLSAFGLVRDIIKSFWNTTTSIKGQILLFLRQPKPEPKMEYVDMLLLPRNVPLQEVKAQHPYSDYISVASNCELIKDETYTAHSPTAKKIQPNKAKFDMEFGPNYHVTFKIDFALNTEEITVTVQDQRETEVWKHDIDLTAVPRSPLVSSINLPELRQSDYSLERTPPVTIGPLQRNVPLKHEDRNPLLSILKDLNDDEFKDFKWRLKSELWNNIEPIKEDQLSKAERHKVVDLMVQTYEMSGAVQVMESILEKVPRNDLVKKLRC